MATLRTKDPASLIFITASLCALFLVWWPSYLPMVDAPNHLARLHIMSAPADSPLRQMYTVDWELIPDLGLDLVYASLRGFVSPEATLRLCVFLSFLLILSAIGMIQRTLFGRLTYSASAAPIFLFGSAWHVGYINFLMGMSIVLMALAIYIVAGRRLTPIVAVVEGVAGMAALMCHVSAFAGFAVLLTGLHLSDDVSRTHATPLRSLMRKTAAVAIVLLPGAVLWLACEKPAHTSGIQYTFEKLKILLAATLGTGNWSDTVILVGVTVLFILTRRAGAIQLWNGGKISLILLVSAILVLPNSINNAVDVDSRLVMLAVLVCLSMTKIDLMSGNRGSRALVAGLCMIIVARMASILVLEYSYDHTVAEFRNQAAIIAPGTRVLVGIDNRIEADCSVSSEDLDFPDIMAHLASYATIDRQAFVPLIFTGAGMQPIRLKNDYASLGAPASVPVPATILLMATNPTLVPRLELLLRRNYLPTYFIGWPSKFDYVILIHHGCARNPFGAIVRSVAQGRIFTIYKLIKSQSPNIPL